MTQRQRTCELKGSVGTSQMLQKTLGTFFCSSFFFVGLAFAKPAQLTAVWFLPRKASTIWCFTTDSEVTWQECQPIGVLRPACKHGILSAVGEPAPLKWCQHKYFSAGLKPPGFHSFWALEGVVLLSAPKVFKIGYLNESPVLAFPAFVPLRKAITYNLM